MSSFTLSPKPTLASKLKPSSSNYLTPNDGFNLSHRPSKSIELTPNDRPTHGLSQESHRPTLNRSSKPFALPPLGSETRAFNRTDSGLNDRQKVRVLTEKIEQDLEKCYVEHSAQPDLLMPSVMNVCEEGFKAIIEQNMVICKDRGNLLKKLWTTYLSMVCRERKISQLKESKASEKHFTKISELNEKHQQELSQLQGTNMELIAKLESLDSEAHQTEIKMKLKSLKEDHLNKQFQKLQQHYRALKQEIFNLKEDNRILLTKLESCHFQIEENPKGYLIPRLCPELRIKHKSSQFLAKELNKDPMLNPQAPLDIHEFGKVYLENYENSLFSIPDYKSRGTDPIEPACQEIGLEPIRDFMVNKATYVHFNEPSAVLPRSSSEEIPSSLIKFKSFEETDLEIDTKKLKDKIKKHRRVKQLFQGIHSEATLLLQLEGMPHAPLLNDLLKCSNNVLEYVASHPLDSKPITCIEAVPESLLAFVKSTKPENSNEFIHKRLSKISSTPLEKIKLILTKKALLKIIDDSFANVELSTEFSQYIYNIISKKLRMTKAVNNRFDNIARSAMKYKYITRIRLFGRLLGLYSPFSLPDTKFFFHCLSILDPPSITDSDSVSVPYSKCEDLLNNMTELSSKDLRSIEKKLSSLPLHDSKVSCDDFLEILMNHYTYRKSQSLNFLKCIFEASDLNNDGHLELHEFKLLVNHISLEKHSPSSIHELFQEYCENFLTEEDTQIQALSLENLSAMNAQCHVFTREGLLKFAQVRSDGEALSKLHQIDNLQRTLNEIYWRFSETQQWKKYLGDLRKLLELLRIKISDEHKPFVHWVSLRLFDQESKRALVRQTVAGLLPLIANISS